MKKHICFVTKYYGVPRNGPSTFANNFVTNIMKDNRYQLTIISGEEVENLENKDILFYTPTHHLIDGLKIRKLLKKVNRKNKIDLIYFNCFRNAVFSTNLRIPYILNVNDHHPFITNKQNVWKVMAPRIFINSKMNLFNSNFTRQKVISNLNLNKKSINTDVTYKGINLNDFTYNFQEVNVNREIKFLYIGTDFYRKGMDIILESLKIFKKNNNIKFSIDIIGEDNNLEFYRKMVEQYNLRNEVRFLGRQGLRTVINFQKNAHILLLPSREEAFGVVLLEALASGTSVIASNVGGIPSIIEDQHNGILIKSHDSKALYNAIIYLIKHPNKRKSMVENGLETVKRFNFDSVYKRIMNHINKTLNINRIGNNNFFE